MAFSRFETSFVVSLMVRRRVSVNTVSDAHKQGNHGSVAHLGEGQGVQMPLATTLQAMAPQPSSPPPTLPTALFLGEQSGELSTTCNSMKLLPWSNLGLLEAALTPSDFRVGHCFQEVIAET